MNENPYNFKKANYESLAIKVRDTDWSAILLELNVPKGGSRQLLWMKNLYIKYLTEHRICNVYGTKIEHVNTTKFYGMYIL